MSADEIELDPKLGSAAAAPAQPAELEAPEALVSADTIDGTARLGSSAEIAQHLSTGQLDPVSARALLIRQVITEQLPAGLPADQLEGLRAQLELLLGDDPNLANLLRA